MTKEATMFRRRLARVRQTMIDRGVDTLLLSVGADLPSLHVAQRLDQLAQVLVPDVRRAPPRLLQNLGRLPPHRTDGTVFGTIGAAI